MAGEGNAIAAGVAEVFARVLKVDVRGVDAEIRLGGHPAWDSVGHIDLVLAVEAAFGVSFASYEIPELASVAQIVRAVEQRVASPAGGGAAA
jgi:acyl carrier protein